MRVRLGYTSPQDQQIRDRLASLNQAVNAATGEGLGSVSVTSSRNVKVKAGKTVFSAGELTVSRRALEELSDPELQALTIRQMTPEGMRQGSELRFLALACLSVGSVGMMLMPPVALAVIGLAIWRSHKIVRYEDRRVNAAAVVAGVSKDILADAIEKDQSKRYIADRRVNAGGIKKALLKPFTMHEGKAAQAAQVRTL